MASPYRTHSCGAIRPADNGSTVTLSGWVNNYRDHGGVRFVDLRDREGLTQVVFHPEAAAAHETAQKLRHEDVIRVTGKVVKREGGVNPKLATGEVEVDAAELTILNKSQTPPFTPDDAAKVGEETRLRHRYLDMRRPRMQEILRKRHRVTKTVRDFCDEHGFLEIETPFLCRSTPEGARDFLVPSRLQAGSFYALPQSPQLFKQLLMVGGAERYVQIVRCFRDEDPRADRQAEFTQVDLEMSFVDQEDVISLCEGMIRRVWKEVAGVDVPEIPRMPYAEAMARFGSDRPDLRFGMELVDVTEVCRDTGFKVFDSAVASGGAVKLIRVPGGSSLTRKQTDALAEFAKGFGGGGLPVCKVEEADGKLQLATGVAKFLESVGSQLIEAAEAEAGDLLCFGVDPKPAIVDRVLGELRIKLAHDLDLIDLDQNAWVWVVDFPLVEWLEEPAGLKPAVADGASQSGSAAAAKPGRWHALHHPFTAPADGSEEALASGHRDRIAAVTSLAYDLVLNGSELGGGSIRVHSPEQQARIFELLGIDEEEQRDKFGFLLDALQHGAPPHGGLAFGLDRIVMHLVGTTNIRDVIAFPKTQNGADLLTEAPSSVDGKQLEELGLVVRAGSKRRSEEERE